MTALADPPAVDTPAEPPDPGAEGWSKDKQGRYYVPARGRSGVVYRKGNETVDEAHLRDSKGPKDKRPKSSKPKTAPKAPAPTSVSLQELEFAIKEALSTPAMIAAMQGDEWAADHFTTQAPALARNLTKAAEHNPWLRAKLEAAMSGDMFLMKIATLMPVFSAAVAYLIPPIIYYFDPGFLPPQAREMFRVPDRDEVRQQQEQHAADAPAPAEADRPPGPVATPA